MSSARIEVEVGQFRFSGEGEQQWLAQQMDKILKSAEELTKLAPLVPPLSSSNGERNSNDDLPSTNQTLPQFLKKASATTQVDKFLATAEWLYRKGNRHIKPLDVTKALKDAHQNKLTNPSQCLAENVNKGYCEKDGKSFYVTDEGRKHLKLT